MPGTARSGCGTSTSPSHGWPRRPSSSARSIPRGRCVRWRPGARAAGALARAVRPPHARGGPSGRAPGTVVSGRGNGAVPAVGGPGGRDPAGLVTARRNLAEARALVAGGAPADLAGTSLPEALDRLTAPHTAAPEVTGPV